MVIKIITSILTLFACFMGLKQGYAMLSGKPQMVEMFTPWGFSPTALSVFGVITMLSGVLLLFPKTFFWGNFLMGAGIFMIICFQIFHGDFKGAAIEFPFLLLNLVLIYLKYPFIDLLKMMK